MKNDTIFDDQMLEHLEDMESHCLDRSDLQRESIIASALLEIGRLLKTQRDQTRTDK